MKVTCVKYTAIKQLRDKQVKMTIPSHHSCSREEGPAPSKGPISKSGARKGRRGNHEQEKAVASADPSRTEQPPSARAAQAGGTGGSRGWGKDSHTYPVSRPQRTEGTSYVTPRDTLGKGLRQATERAGQPERGGRGAGLGAPGGVGWEPGARGGWAELPESWWWPMQESETPGAGGWQGEQPPRVQE